LQITIHEKWTEMQQLLMNIHKLEIFMQKTFKKICKFKLKTSSYSNEICSMRAGNIVGEIQART
jgi:hypothetical protein